MSNSQSGGYADSPAAALVATLCACCSTALVDAVSVETGIGPVCRKKHGFAAAQGAPVWQDVRVWLDAFNADLAPERCIGLADGDERHLANKIVHRIAVEQKGARVADLVNALRALGFLKLAERITKRLVTIRITVEGDELVIKTPYAPEAVAAFRQVPGRRWDEERQVNRVSACERQRVWRLLRAFFAGRSALGPTGNVFVIA